VMPAGLLMIKMPFVSIWFSMAINDVIYKGCKR